MFRLIITLLLLCTTIHGLYLSHPSLSLQPRKAKALNFLTKRDPPDINNLNINYVDRRPNPRTPMSDADIEIVRTAIANARALAEVVLHVAPDDPLVATYFGQDIGTGQYDTVRRVFAAIRDFNPDPLTPLTIFRRGNPPAVHGVGAEAGTRPDRREMDLYTGFWNAQEMAHTAAGAMPVTYPPVLAGAALENADNPEIDRMSYQRGAIMLHELVHYVTGQDYTLLGPAFERLFPNPHTRPDLTNLGAALDLAPLEWVVQGTNVRNPISSAASVADYCLTPSQDAQIVQALPAEYHQPLPNGRHFAAYTNVAVRALVRMQRGRDLSLMNASSYAHFAIAVFFNRRAATMPAGTVPGRDTYNNLPTVFEDVGPVWLTRPPFWADSRVYQLIATLYYLNFAGALGKVPPPP
ncbi:hypothetical protein K458DRAFT_386738 [Lentithecium fluviatile CBS 122367]|uniref:Uncharacterized protein n=1 Tax=Lentithecium fluviatile CBS 122367 TaxID=1168545 RepID=A0A6G1J890_9PLEO|nr:hypothetical protein K458DRAFT_386738 [Lentithecium fluviatile CBS 122367]